MEGIEYQHRPREPQFKPFADHTYPLSLDRRIEEGDEYRRAEEELSASLKSIEESFDPKHKRAHDGSPECETCTSQKSQLWQAYRNFYLGEQPGRWDANLSSYRKELTDMFDDPKKFTLENIHLRFNQEVRQHLKRDICSVRDDVDSADHEDLKSRLQQVLDDESLSIAEALVESLNIQLHVPGGLPREEADFLSSLQTAKTAEERAKIYQKYYCTPSYNDSPQLKNLKAKYERLFDSGLSHDAVIAQWKNEALEIQRQKSSQLNRRLGELKMAQSAQLRDKKRKAEKSQRLQDIAQSQMPRCSLPQCQKVIELEGDERGPLECVICDWLASKPQPEGQRREHFYYCSEEHAEEDFSNHDLYEHACVMDTDCRYEGSSIPDNTIFGGVCRDCLEAGYISYFCTQECWHDNRDAHRHDFHSDKEIQAHSQDLELFHPEPTLEIAATAPLSVD